jgi:protein-S-isoprenylcysteine O-methyltransferase Ste14
LYAALPPSLVLIRPRWLILAIVLALLVPIMISHRVGQHRLNEVLGYVLNAVVTVAMIVSLVRLLSAVTDHTIAPPDLLRSAAALWVSNILVFASWYWRLDGGGPHERARTPGHTDGAFLFPQMTMDPAAKKAAGEHDWEPNFIDYLFLAFNTSTAFSPTDVPVLSRWAKILMMIQSLISLLVIALLAGRAVNIL